VFPDDMRRFTHFEIEALLTEMRERKERTARERRELAGGR
jgi:hypothetical protein